MFNIQIVRPPNWNNDRWSIEYHAYSIGPVFIPNVVHGHIMSAMIQNDSQQPVRINMRSQNNINNVINWTQRTIEPGAYTMCGTNSNISITTLSVVNYIPGIKYQLRHS